MALPWDFRRASEAALAEARHGGEPAPWAALALVALEPEAELSAALAEAWADWQGGPGGPQAEATLGAALASLSPRAPHRLFRRAYTLIVANPNLLSALLPNLFVATVVQGCLDRDRPEAPWGRAVDALLALPLDRPTDALADLKRLDDAFFDATSPSATDVTARGPSGPAQGLPVILERLGPAPEEGVLASLQAALEACEPVPDAHTPLPKRQRWEWAWALGNLVAQRRSGVLPAAAALDARLPALLAVFTEPRAALPAPLFDGIIEEIDLWASGFEAAAAPLPPPPEPEPEPEPGALPSPLPAVDTASSAAPREGFGAAELTRLRSALAGLEAEAAAGTPALRRALGQLEATLAPLLWLEAAALSERFGRVVLFKDPLEAVEPGLLDGVAHADAMDGAEGLCLRLAGGELGLEGGGRRQIVPWRCLRLQAAALRLVPAPPGALPPSLSVHAVPSGFGAGMPRALGITVVGKAMFWVYLASPSEGRPVD